MLHIEQNESSQLRYSNLRYILRIPLLPFIDIQESQIRRWRIKNNLTNKEKMEPKLIEQRMV